MRLVLPILALCLFISGCATTSPRCDIPRAEGDKAVTIVMYRPSASWGILYSAPFSIDDCRVKNLRNHAYVVYKLPAGFHRIAAEHRAMENGEDAVLSREFEAGKTYYLYYSIGRDRTYYVPPTYFFSSTGADFYFTSKEHALRLMPKLADGR